MELYNTYLEFLHLSKLLSIKKPLKTFFRYTMFTPCLVHLLKYLYLKYRGSLFVIYTLVQAALGV